MTRAVLLSVLVFVSAAAAAKSPALASLACGREITQVLDGWEKHRFWRWAPGGADSHDTFKTPTSQLGVWITLDLHRNGDVGAVLRSPGKTIALHWTPRSCDPRVAVLEKKPDPSATAFTDAHLRKLAAENGRGIVYAWSPHMPFSLAGFATIKKAAARLGLKVFAVLDPYADPEAARRDVDRHGLERGALMRMESIELFEREMPIHYPSIVVFSGGRVVGPTIPGFKEAETYVRLIAENLKR